MYNTVNAAQPYVEPAPFSLKGLDFGTLPLLSFDHEMMIQAPPPFDFEKDGEFAEFLADGLYDRMTKMGGVGLAANQISIPLRIFVFGNAETKLHIFNPHIIGVSKETVAMQEGCLSLPGFFLTLQRPKTVTASYQDIKGETVVGTFEGIGARIFLHEYDHMEGINFLQHASKFKLKWETDKLKKKILRAEKYKKQVRK